MIDWLIVGGGVHGSCIARALLSSRRYAGDRVRLLDPHTEPLHRFLECAAATGMEYMRSPAVHHLDGPPMSLFHFAKTPEGARYPGFRGFTSRPSFAMWSAHCRRVLADLRWSDLWLQGEALALGRQPSGYRVETTAGSIAARRVVLAIGASSQPEWPPWGLPFRPTVRHLFDPGRVVAPEEGKDAVLVGGGLSAVQAALRLARDAPGRVTLLSRHPLRIAQYDVEPCWMGPKCMAGFAREADLGRRRETIRAVRHRGSVTPEVARDLQRALRRGELSWVAGEVAHAEKGVPDGLVLTLEDGRSLKADQVILATGFSGARPGRGWLDEAVESLGLPVAACGYPVVSPRLAWCPGIYVTGPLADLEIGPTSRNLQGARLACRRILAGG